MVRPVQDTVQSSTQRKSSPGEAAQVLAFWNYTGYTFKWWFPELGVPPVIIHVYVIFQYKATSLDTPVTMEPHIYIYIFGLQQVAHLTAIIPVMSQRNLPDGAKAAKQVSNTGSTLDLTALQKISETGGAVFLSACITS